MVQDQEGDLRNVTVARIEPTLAAELTQYENNVPITTNGLHDINFLTTINRAVQRYKVSVEVPTHDNEYLSNGINLTTNGTYQLKNYLSSQTYDGVQKDTNLIVNVPQTWKAQAQAIGPLLRNGTYNLANYIDVGYNALSNDSTVEVRVDSIITIDRIVQSARTYMLNTFTYTTVATQVNISNYKSVIYIVPPSSSNHTYSLYFYANGSSGSKYVNVPADSYYILINDATRLIRLRDPSDNNVLSLYDDNSTDNNAGVLILYETMFYLDFTIPV